MGLPIDEPEGMMGPAANQMAEASLSVLEGAVAIGEVLAGGVNSQEDEDMGSGHRKSTSTTIGLTSGTVIISALYNARCLTSTASSIFMFSAQRIPRGGVFKVFLSSREWCMS
jgi:hypothetical protein